MKILLIHPEDGLQAGPWASSRCDRVIDLGRAGVQSYARAAGAFGCAVTSVNDLRQSLNDMGSVRDLLRQGFGRLCDQFDLDWWELTAIFSHHQLDRVILLHDFLETLTPLDEVYLSRPGFEAEALRIELGQRLHIFPAQASREKGTARHYFRVLRRFPVSQLLEIFWDKHDAGYQRRGLLSGKRKPQDAPVVLLPTAYGNASRTDIAYANILPDERFLLVATRRSGWIERPPANVSTAWLRSYASVGIPARKAEYADLMDRWHALRRELESVPEFSIFSRLGGFDDFPRRFARGLEIRDAWRNVLDTEPVQAVICTDDSNPYTHIPLLLAKARGLPTVSCHHGALDGRYLFKPCHADVILAKGRMEEDYLVRVCNVPANRVEVGAPLELVKEDQASRDLKPLIVVFSEAYEAMGGRAADVYQDILPGLADLARAEKRELVVKLHPAESASERRRIIHQTLLPRQRPVVRVVSGPLQSEMLDETWFGITILSTVAADCALRGIPCFLCKWLESSPYGYVDQFTRFGVGIRLNGPEEIKQIPGMLRQNRPNAATSANLWSPIAKDRLRVLLGIDRSREQGKLSSTASTVGKL